MQAFHKSHLSKMRVAPSETAMGDVLREECPLFLPLSFNLPFVGYPQILSCSISYLSAELFICCPKVCQVNCRFRS